MVSSLRRSSIPVISPEGVPLQARTDLEAATRAVLLSGALDVAVRRFQLNGSCQIISLGSAVDPAGVDAGLFRVDVVRVLSPTDVWKRGVNPALDGFEDRCILALTDENEGCYATPGADAS